MSSSDTMIDDRHNGNCKTNRQHRAAAALLDDLKFEDSPRLAEREGQSIRMDLVNQIRQQIADGHYVDDEKIDLAIDRLLVDIDPQ